MKKYNIIEVLNAPVGTKFKDNDNTIWEVEEEGEESKVKILVDISGEKELYLDSETINVTFEEIKKEIDWTKVPRGTKVQVRDKEDGLWKNKYFVKFEAIDGYYPFIASIHLDNDFTNYKMEIDACEWQYCRIHPIVEIPDEWYKEVE